MTLIDRIPLGLILAVALFLAVAPIVPEPHLVEKFNMLMSGTLTKAIDIFDVFWHVWPMVLVVIKIVRLRQLKADNSPPT